MTLRLGRHEFADDRDADDGDRQPHARLVLRQGRHLGRGQGVRAGRRWSSARAPRSSTSAASRPRPAPRSAPPRRRRAWSTSWRGCARRSPTSSSRVDTWRAEVGDAACAAGADLLNDAWGGADPELVDAAAQHGAAIVCTHTGGVTPRTRPYRIEYDDVVAAAIADTVALRRAGGRRRRRPGAAW